MKKQYILFKVFHTGVFIVCEEMTAEYFNLIEEYGSPEYGNESIDECINKAKNGFNFKYVDTIVLPTLMKHREEEPEYNYEG